MEFGFVPVAAPVVPAIGQGIVNAVGAVAAVLAGQAFIQQTIDNANKPPEVSVGGDISFEPWGPDPYEKPAPAPLPPLVSTTPDQALLVPEAPSPINETVANTALFEQRPEPQTEPTLTPDRTQVPPPPTGPAEGDLGGWANTNGTYVNNPEYWGYTPSYDTEVGEKILFNWNRVNYTFIIHVDDWDIKYEPAIEFYLGTTKTRTWHSGLLLPTVPLVRKYEVTVWYDDYPDGQNQQPFVLTDLAPFDPYLVPLPATVDLSQLPLTIRPAAMPELQTKLDENPLALPQVQPITEPETQPLPNIAPPVPEVEPQPDIERLAPPPLPLVAPRPIEEVPLRPNTPQPVPALTEDGKPLRPPVLPLTPPDAHYVDGLPKPVTGNGPAPTLPSIAQELGRIEQKQAGMAGQLGGFFEQLDNILDLIELLDLIKDLFEQPYPAQTYSITGVCEEGETQPSTDVALPEEKWADRLISLGDMVPTLLQAHLGYKTPICGQAPSNEKPELDGTWISTRWVSDGDSPGSNSRLRKLFRYRSKSTRNADELRAYWSGITWEAGPVIVQHKGAWWGTPQIWASSESEGKRILRFAGGEAGIDPDLDGEWVVGGSSSPRYGQTGTMRLAQPRGEYWVTRRDGPSGPALS